MNIKKLLCVILCILMAIGVFAGCQNSTDDKTQDQKTETSALKSTEDDSKAETETKEEEKETEMDSSSPNFDKKIEFTYASMFPFDAEEEWTKQVMDKFNIFIDHEQMTWDTWGEKTNVMFASGEMADVVMWNFKYGNYKKLASEGVLKDIPEFGDKYPNLNKVRTEMKAMEAIEVDGKLYAWLRAKFMSPYKGLSTMGLLYRKDWAEQVGITETVVTTDEFIDLLKTFRDQDPGNNGEGNTIPFTTADIYMPYAFMQFFNPDYSSYVEVDGKYEWGARLPSTLEGIKFIKELYDEGLIWKDFYTQKASDHNDQFLSNRVGVLYHNYPLGQLNGILKGYENNNPGTDSSDIFGFLHVVNSTGKVADFEDGEYWSSIVFSPKIEDEKLERILYFMDWLAGEEGTKWCTYGTEGVDWTQDSEGNVELNWVEDENGKLKGPGYLSMYIRQLYACGGDEDSLNPAVTEFAKSLFMKNLDDKREIGIDLTELDYSLKYLSTPNKDKFGSFSQEVDDQIIKMIISSDDLEADWDAWLKSMEGKVNPILDEINGALN